MRWRRRRWRRRRRRGRWRAAGRRRRKISSLPTSSPLKWRPSKRSAVVAHHKSKDRRHNEGAEIFERRNASGPKNYAAHMRARVLAYANLVSARVLETNESANLRRHLASHQKNGEREKKENKFVVLRADERMSERSMPQQQASALQTRNNESAGLAPNARACRTADASWRLVGGKQSSS